MGAGPDQDETGVGAAAPAPDPFGRTDPPLLALTLWPNRPLTARGGAWTLGLAAAGLGLPLVGLAGSAVAWGMLPFLAAPLGGLYLALKASAVSGRLREDLRLWPDLITVERREPQGTLRRWHADPFWVRLQLFAEGRVVENYLTLTGNGREIELGAFLSPGERADLHRDLGEALAALRRPGG